MTVQGAGLLVKNVRLVPGTVKSEPFPPLTPVDGVAAATAGAESPGAGAPRAGAGTLVDILIDAEGNVQRIDRRGGAPAGVSDGAPAGGPDADPESVPVLDGQGLYAAPAWIDLHTHIYVAATDIGVEPAAIGPETGVGTLVDCGSAGEANWAGFERFVASQADFEIRAFINIGSIGLVAGNRVLEVASPEYMNIERTLQRVAEARHRIRGVKVRSSGFVVRDQGMTPLKFAEKTARLADLPLVVHVGEPPPFPEDVLPLLQAGDLVTHCFHDKPGGDLFAHRRAAALAKEAAARGVLFDVGHGAASFSFQAARLGLDEGFLPFSISTDAHVRNVHGPVWDLATCMSKLLALGMALEDIVQAVTVRPAQFLGEPELGYIQPGRRARITLFRLEAGDYPFTDSIGQVLKADRFIRPRYTIIGTKVVPADSRFAGRFERPV